MPKLRVELFWNDDEDHETEMRELELPAKYEVCDRCEGEGKHSNPSIDGNGITSEEWDRDWDEESREAYMSGFYDVKCEECDGLRVVLVPDEDRCEREFPAEYQQWIKEQEQRAQWDRDDRAIRRMESGGYG